MPELSENLWTAAYFLSRFGTSSPGDRGIRILKREWIGVMNINSGSRRGQPAPPSTAPGRWSRRRAISQTTCRPTGREVLHGLRFARPAVYQGRIAKASVHAIIKHNDASIGPPRFGEACLSLKIRDKCLISVIVMPVAVHLSRFSKEREIYV
jgi:hypothetical protein